jgi:thymidylate synthase
MTAINLENKFEYKPLYKPNQLICGTGQTAIVSAWTVKSAILLSGFSVPVNERII